MVFVTSSVRYASMPKMGLNPYPLLRTSQSNISCPMHVPWSVIAAAT